MVVVDTHHSLSIDYDCQLQGLIVLVYMYFSLTLRPTQQHKRTDHDTTVARCLPIKHIDYIISHIWHDNVQAKFTILDTVKQQFKANTTR